MRPPGFIYRKDLCENSIEITWGVLREVGCGQVFIIFGVDWPIIYLDVFSVEFSAFKWVLSLSKNLAPILFFMEYYKNTSFENIVDEINGVVFTEQWVPVPMPEFGDRYLISSFGRLLRLGRRSAGGYNVAPKMMIPTITKKGYLRSNLSNRGVSKSVYMHRLVALSFVENIYKKPDVNHLTGDKTNNHYSLLEWCTPQENNEHGFSIGLLKRGRLKRNRGYIKKGRENCRKPIIDFGTGIFWTTDEVATMLNIKRRYVHRMLNEDRRPNPSQYRYA